MKIKEAPAQGRTIFEYAGTSNAATDYWRVVDALIDGHDAVSAAAPSAGASDDDQQDALTA